MKNTFDSFLRKKYSLAPGADLAKIINSEMLLSCAEEYFNLQREEFVNQLRILPTSMRDWQLMTNRAVRETKVAHPEFPYIRDTQAMSLIKRFAPFLRERIISKLQ